MSDLTPTPPDDGTPIFDQVTADQATPTPAGSADSSTPATFDSSGSDAPDSPTASDAGSSTDGGDAPTVEAPVNVVAPGDASDPSVGSSEPSSASSDSSQGQPTSSAPAEPDPTVSTPDSSSTPSEADPNTSTADSSDGSAPESTPEAQGPGVDGSVSLSPTPTGPSGIDAPAGDSTPTVSDVPQVDTTAVPAPPLPVTRAWTDRFRAEHEGGVIRLGRGGLGYVGGFVIEFAVEEIAELTALLEELVSAVQSSDNPDEPQSA